MLQLCQRLKLSSLIVLQLSQEDRLVDFIAGLNQYQIIDFSIAIKVVIKDTNKTGSSAAASEPLPSVTELMILSGAFQRLDRNAELVETQKEQVAKDLRSGFKQLIFDNPITQAH